MILRKKNRQTMTNNSIPPYKWSDAELINCDCWGRISRYEFLPESFVAKWKDYLDWWTITFYRKLSEEFISKWANYVDWQNVSCQQKLSEEFILEWEDHIYWEMISAYQELSEEFIEKYSELLDWCYVSQFQKLSEKFIINHKKLIDKNSLKKNKHVDITHKISMMLHIDIQMQFILPIIREKKKFMDIVIVHKK